jgi:signal transduction histidine kinase
MEFFILAGEKRRLRKESEFSYNVEHRITRRDGEVRHIIARIRVSKDPEGRITKCYGANQDITEMKKAHQDLQEAYKRLQEVKAQLLHSEKLAVVGQLATGIAHEIKNPLAIILQGADYLHSSLATPQPHLLQVVQMIKEASVRADNTIKELLGFSKQTQTAREERHIVPVIEESLHLVEHQLGLKNVRIIRSFADGLPLVKIDRNQFKQALMNIIMNGVDAIAPLGHGFITISCETIRRERCVRVTIADTGAGIPADVLPRIFDPFFTTKRKEKNVGLGLTITQHIIEQHDGTMKIESDATGGTRVIIDLPAMND